MIIEAFCFYVLYFKGIYARTEEEGMTKSLKVSFVFLLCLISQALQADEEEPQGFSFSLEKREESPSAIDRHLNNEWGFSNESTGDTIGACSSCGT